MTMKQFWQSLADANDELNAFINGGLPSTTEKRHKDFVRRWEKMKEKAEVLCDQIEKQADADGNQGQDQDHANNRSSVHFHSSGEAAKRVKALRCRLIQICVCRSGDHSSMLLTRFWILL